MQIVSSDQVKALFSISVFENKLYWTSWYENEILECDKFTGKDVKTLVHDPPHRIYRIYVHHPSLHAKDVRKFDAISI